MFFFRYCVEGYKQRIEIYGDHRSTLRVCKSHGVSSDLDASRLLMQAAAASAAHRKHFCITGHSLYCMVSADGSVSSQSVWVSESREDAPF